jgi:hypothetical protein
MFPCGHKVELKAPRVRTKNANSVHLPNCYLANAADKANKCCSQMGKFALSGDFYSVKLDEIIYFYIFKHLFI